jgi:proline iminopeptidase
LICVGDLDPVTPIECAREILRALPPDRGRMEVIGGAGHFLWLDQPERLWATIEPFVAAD